MISRIAFPLASALFCAGICSGQSPLNVKPGEWESTISNDTRGQLPVPQEMIDKMSPEQRAKMEAMMKARGLGGPANDSQQTLRQEGRPRQALRKQ